MMMNGKRARIRFVTCITSITAAALAFVAGKATMMRIAITAAIALISQSTPI